MVVQHGTGDAAQGEPDLGYRRIHGEVGRLSYKADCLTTLGRQGAIATHQRKTLAEDLPVILLSPGSSHRASLLAVCPLKAQECDDEHN